MYFHTGEKSHQKKKMQIRKTKELITYQMKADCNNRVLHLSAQRGQILCYEVFYVLRKVNETICDKGDKKLKIKCDNNRGRSFKVFQE